MRRLCTSKPLPPPSLRPGLNDSVTSSPAAGPLRIALAGNPNSGKTSLFNILTGAHQHVGNWGGVTVEVKEGRASVDGRKARIVDLPGTYSLSAYSMEERVARDFIIEERPDVVINVIDATNLERNLYLTVQLIELGIRPVLALNMWDEVQSKGIRIDCDLLSRLLDLPVVSTNGKTGENADVLLKRAIDIGEKRTPAQDLRSINYGLEIEKALAALISMPQFQAAPVAPRWAALKTLENDTAVIAQIETIDGGPQAVTAARDMMKKIELTIGEDTESLIAEARYGFIAGALRQVLSKPLIDRVEISDRIDRVLTHPVWAFPVFFLFMWLLFQATFSLGAFPKSWIEMLFGLMGSLATMLLPAGWFRNLVVDGIISGVGGVAVFLPNILILFFGIAIMEDTGYMARAAFITDKLMQKVGLHGKSFIPMIMGMGCNVPAIMAARTLESPVDRIKTVLLAPLISCSARLPVYVLFAGALFPRHAGSVVFLYQFVLGTVSFFAMAWIFKKTLFRGEQFPFVMELPPYRLPTFRSVAIHMWHRAEHYLKKMGGVVLIFSIVIWVLSSYPVNKAAAAAFDREIGQLRATPSLTQEEKESRVASLEAQHRTAMMKHTFIGQIGTAMEPLVRPLGYDWRGAVSLATGFVAKEIVVSSMGVLYSSGRNAVNDDEQLSREIARNFTPLAGISFMLFVLLYTPCIVALVTVIRELRDVKWSLFSLTYQIAFAWIAAFLVYQGGRLLGLE
jgi:ferrous iron transport protein B